MKEYRTCIVGPDGHFLGRIDFVCEDDDAARQCAWVLVDGHAVEPGRAKSLIAEYGPDRQYPLAPSAMP